MLTDDHVGGWASSRTLRLGPRACGRCVSRTRFARLVLPKGMEVNELRWWLAQLLESGCITPSRSERTRARVLSLRKTDGTISFVIDCRRVNAEEGFCRFVYPVSDVEATLKSIASWQVMAKLWVPHPSPYHQVHAHWLRYNLRA